MGTDETCRRTPARMRPGVMGRGGASASSPGAHRSVAGILRHEFGAFLLKEVPRERGSSLLID